MDYRTCIQNSIDYIEEHLQECMTVDELAIIAGFSSYHYYPQKYRIHASGQIPKKVNLLLLVQYNLTGGIIVEPKIVTKPACKVAGYELKTTNREGKNLQEIPAFWGNMTQEQFATLHKKLHVVHHNEMGICFPPDSATGDFSYVIAVEVQDDEGVPADMFRSEIPEATYAVFAVPPVESMGPEFSNAIQGAWKYIYNNWFPDSGYEFAGGKVDYELYCEGTKVEIYIPIVKKG
jgi:AraC family transcriptional regulator